MPGTDFVLEKNTFVLVSNYGLQRDPEYYPDPLKFDPERFYPENKGTRPFVANLPFGEGPRICIGRYFVLTRKCLRFPKKLIPVQKNRLFVPNFYIFR